MSQSLRALSVAALLASFPVVANQPLDLSVTPLFLNAAVDPNIMVTVDDSGSMNWGFMPDSTLINCYQRRPQMYASNRNLIYYNPDYEYLPPLQGDGTPYPDANFFAAREDGFNPASALVNLQTQYKFTVRISNNPFAPSIYVTHETGATSLASCGNTWQFPGNSAGAFYCKHNPGTPANVDSNYQCQTVPDDERQNFANWYSYYRLRGYSLRTAVSHAFARLDDNMRIGWQGLNTAPIVAATKVRKFTAQVRNEFHSFVAGAFFNNNTPAITAAIRAGEFFKRSGLNELNPYYDAELNMELTCRQNYHLMLSDGYYNDPIWPSEAAAASSILTSRTLPDGRTYDPAAAVSKIIGNELPRIVMCGALQDKLCSPSYSDVAFHYWSSDLRPDLDNEVAQILNDRNLGVSGPAGALPANPFNNNEVYFNPANDPANWQHLVQFYIAFGLSGTLAQTPQVLTQLRNGSLPWPSPVQDQQRALDDAWHATLVSRGRMFAANNVQQLSAALVEALSTVVRRRGTAAPVSVSTGILNSSSLSYQTLFDSGDWSGSVIARQIGADFSAGAIVWDAGCLLTGGSCESTGANALPVPDPFDDRRILTSTSASGDGAAFVWSELSADQQGALNRNPVNGQIDDLGEMRWAWLRGDRQTEVSAGGPFRDRRSLFGAVVHSGAVYVAAPNAGFERDWPEGSPEQQADEAGQGYAQFKASNAERAATLYVGANDGMLHALNADTGEERFAYVPWAVYPNLARLTHASASYQPFVDLTPTVRDAFVGNRWRTLLIGGLRRGGQGLYALDVSNPEVTEAGAGDTVLWEFNQEADADLGYTYGQPFITRLAHGKWVVLLPAAYNSHESDDYTGTGQGLLFVLDASTGAIVRKFELGIDAAGLAAPIAADLDGDEISEYAYAGDLAGRIWRFDLQAQAPEGWSIELFFEPQVPGERPITAQPRLLRDPVSGRPRVLVGSGKFLEPGDRSTEIPVQSFYGLLDQGELPILQSELQSREVEDDGNLRRVTEASGNGNRGWMIEFTSPAAKGERVIATAAVRAVGDIVIFPTLIPRANDPCKPGIQSVLMLVKASDGGPASDEAPSFDTVGNGVLDAGDDPSVVGRRIEDYVAGIASVIPPGGGIGAILVPGTDGPQAIAIPEFDWRRRAWRDLTP